MGATRSSRSASGTELGRDGVAAGRLAAATGGVGVTVGGLPGVARRADFVAGGFAAGAGFAVLGRDAGGVAAGDLGSEADGASETSPDGAVRGIRGIRWDALASVAVVPAVLGCFGVADIAPTVAACDG